MPRIINCAEGGTDGVAVTTANSGGLSGTAVSSIGAPANFSAAAAYHGSLGYEMVWTASASGQMIWNFSSATRAVLRFYFMFPGSVPNAQEYLASFRHTSGNMAHVTVNSAGRISIQNAAGAGRRTMVDNLVADTWYRVELAVTKGTTTSDGRIEFAYYLGDSTTEIESWDSSVENTGINNVQSVRIGRNTSSTLARTNYYDSIEAADLVSGWIGPAYVASPGGIASAEAFGTATITQGAGGLTVSPTGIGSSEAFGTPTVSTTLSVAPSGIASSEAFGTAAVTKTLTVSPAGIASAQAFGTPVISSTGGPITVSPAGIPSGEAFGTPTITVASPGVIVYPEGIPSQQAFGTPTITRVNPPQTVSPSGIPSLQAFGTPFLSNILVTFPSGIPSATAFGNPTITTRSYVYPEGIPSAEAFGNPTLSRSLTISVQGIQSREAFGVVKLGGPGLTEATDYELSGAVTSRRHSARLDGPTTTANTSPRWEGSLG